jgi:hypothetical protein
LTFPPPLLVRFPVLTSAFYRLVVLETLTTLPTFEQALFGLVTIITEQEMERELVVPPSASGCLLTGYERRIYSIRVPNYRARA